MSSSPEENQTSAFRPFTKAERIQQLNEIDKVRLQKLSNPLVPSNYL